MLRGKKKGFCEKKGRQKPFEEKEFLVKETEELGEEHKAELSPPQVCSSTTEHQLNCR